MIERYNAFKFIILLVDNRTFTKNYKIFLIKRHHASIKGEIEAISEDSELNQRLWH